LTRIGEGLAFQKLHLPFRELRQTYKLPGTSSYLEELEGDLTLVCDLPILFPQNVLPSNYHVIGPVYYDAGNSTHNTDLTCDSTKKTILVSMGSSGSWENVAFLNDPFYNRYNVIAVGDSETRLEASHIRHLPFAGMHEIFPNIDLLICHGGNGTLYQALYYNVPILVSTNHCEQEWNLSAFERLGLATRLDHTQEASTLRHLVASCIEQRANSHRARLSAEVRNWQKDMPGILQKIAGGMTTRLVRTG
jgi:UDP:flavonoid glycosyltransferase YjiC (YdhE family)